METKIQQLENQIALLTRQLDEVRGDYYKDNFPTKMLVSRDVQLLGSLRVDSFAPTTFSVGGTPVATQANIAAPAGGATVDTEARSAINSILAVLDAFKFTS